MKKPPQELIDAFLKWYESNPHLKNEDYYRETITRNHLSGLSKSDFIDFFYKFAHEGGQVQSGGYRTSGKFRQMVESSYEQFRPFILNAFDANFDEAKWLAGTKNFKYFGIGLATIYLNRVDKKRFPILNNKVAQSLELFAVSLPTDTVKRYKAVREAQQQLITWFPQFENFYRADALNQFLVGEEDGKRVATEMLSKVVGETSELRYWVYAPGPNAKFWDECWQKGVMVYGADELVDLQTYESKDAIEKALKKALGLKSRPTNDALAAWEFSRVVKPGDVIIAKKGRQQYIGYGIVTGPYVHDTSRVVGDNRKGAKSHRGGSLEIGMRT